MRIDAAAPGLNVFCGPFLGAGVGVGGAVGGAATGAAAGAATGVVTGAAGGVTGAAGGGVTGAAAFGFDFLTGTGGASPRTWEVASNGFKENPPILMLYSSKRVG